jgi:hypothetical protein
VFRVWYGLRLAEDRRRALARIAADIRGATAAALADLTPDDQPQDFECAMAALEAPADDDG